MRREWTSEEITFLEEKVGIYKISTIAYKMNRSYESVRVKMNRLGLSNTKSQTGYVTIGQLASLLRVDRNTVRWWTQKYGFPYIKKATRKSRKFYFIIPSDFWEWAEVHKEKVQFSKIEPQVLLPEPEWVNAERHKDRQVVKIKDYKYWTTKEDQKLLELRKERLTYREIGQILNRSAISVERRYKRIAK